MKNILFFTLSFFISIAFAYSQSSVFVFVDVSGSGPNDMIRMEAKEIALELCQGHFTAKNYSKRWNWIGNLGPVINNIIHNTAKPLIDPQKDGYFMIMPFGVKTRYKEYKFRRIKNMGQVSNFFTHYYPTVFEDAYTYPEIAFAEAASFAKDSSVDINGYYAITLSDGLTDTGSRPPGYTTREEEMIANWQSASAYEIRLGTLKYKGDRKEFKIIVSRVNIKNAKIKSKSPTSVVKDLSLIKPIGTKKHPTKIEGRNINVFWKCLGCDSTALFNVSARYHGKMKGVRNPKAKKLKNIYNTNLLVSESGLYKISIKAAGIGSVTSYATVNVGSSGGNTTKSGGSVFPLFLLLLLAGLGVYGYKKYKRNKEIDEKFGTSDNPEHRSEHSQENDDGGYGF